MSEGPRRNPQGGTSPDAELHRRVADLESEVEALRARLDALASERPAPPARSSRPAPLPGHEPAITPPPSSPPPAPGPDAPPVIAIPRAPARSTPPPVAPPQARSRADLERTIGGRVFAAGGALAVVVGIALLVKLGIDAGWWGRIPPSVRCLSIAGVGFAMLAAAEVLRRRINALAAVGLNASGLGAIYIAAYGAHAYFGLIPSPSVAFGLLGATTALGIAIALRSNQLAVGVLALIGGYLAPVLLRSAESPAIALPLYLLALAAVGLALSFWRRRPFAPMRELAWVGTAILGVLWVFSRGLDEPAIAVMFVFAVWAAFHAELLASAKRSGLLADPAPDPDVDDAPLAPRTSSYKLIHPLALSIATSAWVAWLAWHVMREALWSAYLSPAAIGAAALVAGSILAGHLRVLRDRPRDDAERLGLTLYAQAGAFLIIAVVLAMADWAEIVSLLAVGVGAAAAARLARAPALRHYALASMFVALGRLIFVDPGWLGAGLTQDPVLGLWLSRWSVLAWGTGAAWVAVGWLGAPDSGRGRGTLCVALGALVTALSVVGEHSEAFAVVFAWLIGFGALTIGGTRVRWARADAVGAAGLVLTIGAWALAWLDSGLGRAHPAWRAPGPWVGAVVACVAWGVIELVRRIGPASPVASRPVVYGARGAACAILLIVTSAEIFRSAAIVFDDRTAQHATLSVWWALVGAGAIAAGFWRHWRVARHVGLGLIAIAGIKVVAVDMGAVAPVWRVVAMLALGAIMLAVAVPYAIWSKRAGATGGPGDDVS